MRSHYVRCCGRELHVLEWGDAAAPPIVAWHGFARNAADFTALGEALAPSFRLIAPDTIGRGLSQWSPDPIAEYAVPFYVRLAAELFDTFALERAGWIGTSMGGIVGLAAAATLLRERVAALFLNDITPAAPDPEGVRRIAAYVANPPAFETASEYETYFRAAYAAAGERDARAWRAGAAASMRRLPDGRFTSHYDPAIARAFEVPPQTADAWGLYDTLQIPVMLLRGERSDIAGAEAAREMTRRGPRARVHELPGIGHAPWLESRDQVALVRAFVSAPRTNAPVEPTPG